ncbi:transcription termination/antitermination NusG family protein [Luteolibacter sp. LG18]|uniref:transcription termination/antitermination protein NusG n=1 Tax=Luteolibacter sp. LG18 TaxID=2819286 RepID=UPI002B2FB663|nr:transcription antitermination protein RfaH [Luteolibacter sp. LG18]
MSVEEHSAWYCLRTQTKREHIAAGHLRELEGIEVFCPRLRYRKATRRGKIWWVEPLFPGYVLARFDLDQLERAVTFCQGVRGLVRFGGQVPTVPQSFVNVLHAEISEREASEGDVLTVAPVIDQGEEVEVATGPFRGMKGTVVSIAPAAERVKVLLEFLGQEQAVDLDLFSILMPRRPRP